MNERKKPLYIWLYYSITGLNLKYETIRKIDQKQLHTYRIGEKIFKY